MNKKTIIAIIAVIALVAILGTVLVACNQEDYTKRLEKKGYKVVSGTDILGSIGLASKSIDWSISATNGDNYVQVVKYANSDDAKAAYNDYKDDLDEGYAVKRHGKIVVFGTKQGVKDAE